MCNTKFIFPYASSCIECQPAHLPQQSEKDQYIYGHEKAVEPQESTSQRSLIPNTIALVGEGYYFFIIFHQSLRF